MLKLLNTWHRTKFSSKLDPAKKRFIHSSFSFFQELLAEEPSVFKSVVQKIKKSSKYEQISLEDISGEDKVVRKKGNIYRESKTNKLIFQHEELNSTRCPQQNRWHHYEPESLSLIFFVLIFSFEELLPLVLDVSSVLDLDMLTFRILVSILNITVALRYIVKFKI